MGVSTSIAGGIGIMSYDAPDFGEDKWAGRAVGKLTKDTIGRTLGQDPNTSNVIYEYAPGWEPPAQIPYIFNHRGQIADYKMTDLSNGGGSVPTLSVQKDVVTRLAPADTFTLEIGGGTAMIATVTADGPETGIQTGHIPDHPITAGRTITISESVNGTEVRKYRPQLSCRTISGVTSVREPDRDW